MLAIFLKQKRGGGMVGGSDDGTKVVRKTHGVEFSIARKIADVEDVAVGVLLCGDIYPSQLIGRKR